MDNQADSNEKLTDDSEYKVKLEIFEGPMDLLIHLIRKNEVDIFDIPISIITDQYLEYLDILKAFNIDIAGDFLVMASTLAHIKSRMLLPLHGEDEEEEDPRLEITRPLLEYLQLKDAAGELSERALLERDVFKRSLSLDYTSQFQDDDTILEVNLFQLMDAFKKILEQNIPGVPIEFQPHKWSLKERVSFIMDHLKEKSTIFFNELFNDTRTISEFIITFLALLELMHTGLVRAFQPGPNKDIRLEAHFTEEEEMNHG